MRKYWTSVVTDIRDTRFRHLRTVSLLIMNLFVLLIAIKFSSCSPEPQDGGSLEPTPSLEYDPRMISSLRIEPPLLTCGTSVTVRGFIPDAKIRIYFDGVLVHDEIRPDPDAGTIIVPPMKQDQMVTATQEFDGKESAHSKPEKVQDHTGVYPAGLPPPEFPFLPLYNCGEAIAVDNLPPGGGVKVFARQPFGAAPGTLVAGARGVAVLESLSVTQAFKTSQSVTAQSQLCADVSPYSEIQVVQAAPLKLPTPEATEIHEGGRIITIHNLVNGAKVVIKRAGNILVAGPAPGPHVTFPLNAPVNNQDVLEITQELCGITTPPVTITVQPCSALPPPKIMAPRKGDDVVYPITYEAGSRIRIFAGGIEIGDGGGTLVRLMRPLLDHEKIIVVQTLGNCTSSTSYAVEVGRGLEDPLLSGDCGNIVSFEYGDANDPLRRLTDITAEIRGTVDSISSTPPPEDPVPLHGIVRYPDGPGPFPLVFIAHGDAPANSLPYQGYTYLLDLLAKHCMIAVSIDLVAMNKYITHPVTDARGIVLLRNLQLWREWNRDPGHRFYGKVDMKRIGLVGQEISGAAVLTAQVLNRRMHNPADPLYNFNFNIRALCGLGSLDASSDFFAQTLEGADYYVMQGSHDGVASDFPGHKVYDRALPVNSSTSNFKGLLFVRGANHNMWNTALPTVDQVKVAPSFQFISVADQQLFAKSYVTSFLLASLKGWKSYRYFLNGEATFKSLPAGINTIFQYQDPERIFLNHYEEDDDLKTGSFPGVINIPQGQLVTYSDYKCSDKGPPNFLFEQTDGLLVAWRNAENAAIRIQLPTQLQADNPYEFFAFRAGQSAEQSASLNTPLDPQDLSVQLQFVSATGPEQKVSDYATLTSPIALQPGLAGGGLLSIMQTVRIPWKDLMGNVPYNMKVTEIVLKFNQRKTGKLIIDEIQFTQ